MSDRKGSAVLTDVIQPAQSGFDVFLWFVSGFQLAAASAVLLAPSLSAGIRLNQAGSIGVAGLLMLGGGAAFAASLERLSRSQRVAMLAVAGLPLAILLTMSIGADNFRGSVGMGFMLVGLASVARLIWINGTARWRLLPIIAAVTFATLGLTTTAVALSGGSSPPFGWAQTVLLLLSSVALLFAEQRQTASVRLIAAALSALVLEASITRYLAIDEWIALIYAAALALFLMLRAATRPALRPLVLSLLAVVAVSGTLYLLGAVLAFPGLYGTALAPPTRDLINGCALVVVAVGWLVYLRPFRRVPLWGTAVLACVAMAAVLGALLLPVAAQGAVVKESLTGPYATTLLVLAFGLALLAEPRLSPAAAGPLLVALGSAALALSLDRTFSLDPFASQAHDALALSVISLSIGLTGVMRAQEGAIGGRIFAALAGPLALVTVLYLVSGLALRDVADDAVGLDPVAVLAAADTSRSALFIANIAVAVMSGILLTLTVTRPLASLLRTLRRHARGDAAARTGFTQADELGTVGRALDAMSERTLQQSVRLQNVIDGSLDAYVGLDGEGVITDFNPQAEALTGWSRGEISGRVMSETLIPPLARRAFPSPSVLLAGSGGSRVASRGRFPLLHRDGHLIQCEVAPTAVLLENGEIAAGAFFHDVSEEERRDAELLRLALFDPPTNLPNRALFEDRFGLACVVASRDVSLVGLAIVNIDRFSAVNESVGHAAGDAVLQEVGTRLSGLLRPGDTLARLGGAEFGLVLVGLRNLAVAQAHVADCLAAIRRPIAVEARVLYLTASAGLTVSDTNECSFRDFLRSSEAAAKEARRHGGDSLAVGAPFHVGSNTDANDLVAALHRALERGELFLEYQPIVDLTTRACSRVEALLRWRHPVRGLIPPDEFIPVAEQSQLIRALGYWALGRALDDLATWRTAGADVGVCVNVSARQLNDLGFADSVLETVSRHHLLPGALTLEVTESSFLDRNSRLVSGLMRLRAAGIRLAIDDFGTGYSSIAQLGELPVDEVKIDKSLVSAATSNPNQAALVRASVALASAFHIPFVAEGVENEVTWSFLQDLGPGQVQGFLVSRPMTAVAVLPWLIRWNSGNASRGTFAKVSPL